MLVGRHISKIALHFSGLASMPRWVSMNPRNLPRSTPNTHLSRLRRRLYWRNAVKTAERDLTTIINVYFDTFSHQMTENFVHEPLVGCSGVFEAKRHDSVKIIGVDCNESGLVHVRCDHGDLIVTGICVEKTEKFVSRHAVNKSINVG